MSLAARGLRFALRVYQAFFSALMPSACKFYPSCSHYAAEAVQIHGARRGSWLALRRVARCHPFTRGGVDLVPDAADFSGQTKINSNLTVRGKGNLFCHSERSPRNEGEIPRFARNDQTGGQFYRKRFRLSTFFAHRSEPPQTELGATKEVRP
ncbi:MAG TPA: membrane protein insertion efficiency factor YidD [Candidatus Acidoferrales bacterium]|jgi:putative membrane protein insertion efficiency factor|nr:membrane protein insertion efficiency factor YidD [Candidatus Acidoferrales bacterium]